MLASEHILHLLVCKSGSEIVHPLCKADEHILRVLAARYEVCVTKTCIYLMYII